MTLITVIFSKRSNYKTDYYKERCSKHSVYAFKKKREEKTEEKKRTATANWQKLIARSNHEGSF